MNNAEKVRRYIDGLAPGGYSLNIAGISAGAKIPDAKPSEIKRIMDATGLPHRRVQWGDGMVDVWDINVPPTGA